MRCASVRVSVAALVPVLLAGCAGRRPPAPAAPVREVTVTHDYGIAGRGPTVRRVEQPDGRVRGELLLHLRAYDAADPDERAREGDQRAWLRAHDGCTRFRPSARGGQVCAAPFPPGRPPDWAAALRALDATGLEAPPPAAPPRPAAERLPDGRVAITVCSDGGGYAVRVRRPGRPDVTYGYHDCTPATPAQAAHRDRVAAVVRALLAQALLRPLTAERT